MRAAAAALSVALLAGTLTGLKIRSTHETQRVVAVAPVWAAAPGFTPPATTTTTIAPIVTTTSTEPPRPSTTRVARRRPPSSPTTSRARDTTTTTGDQPSQRYVWAPSDMPAGCTPNGSKETVAEVARCWDHLVSRWAWPNKATVFRIMRCESRGRANAVNGRYRGLMQEDGGSLNPQENLARTWSHSRHGTNWGPWECR